jgi:uncharacterized protein (TIGR03435 family)
MRRIVSGAIVSLLCSAFGQPPQAADGALSFEAASFKAVTPVPGEPINSITGGPAGNDPGRIVYRNVTLETLIAHAFDVTWGFLLEMPDQMRRGRYYDIMATIPAGTTPQKVNQMLIHLLQERLHLKYRVEKRQVMGYEFTVAAGGSKLKESANPDATAITAGSSHVRYTESSFPEVEPGYATAADRVFNGRTFVTARSVPVSYLFPYFFMGMGAPAIKTPFLDHTGLTGKYDANFTFAVPPRDPGADPPGGSSVAVVFEKQLGLVARKKRIEIDVVVIESADRVPSAN